MLAFHRIATAAGVVLSSGCDVRDMAWGGRAIFASRGGYHPQGGAPIVSTPLDSCIVAGTSGDLARKIDAERRRGRDSPFFDYLEEIVPATFPTVPAWEGNWGGGGSSSSEFPVDALACELTRRHIRSLPKASWAEVVVSTRACSLPDGRLALVPGLDLLNHSPTAQGTECSFRTAEEGEGRGEGEEGRDEAASVPVAVEIRTSDDVEEGQEVFIKYGKKSNRDLLCDYGFCLEENEDDEQEVLVPVRPLSPSLERHGSGRREEVAVVEEEEEEEEEGDEKRCGAAAVVRCRVYASGAIDESDVAALRRAIAGAAHLGEQYSTPSSSSLSSSSAVKTTTTGFTVMVGGFAAQQLQPLSEENELAVRDALAVALKEQAIAAVAATAASPTGAQELSNDSSIVGSSSIGSSSSSIGSSRIGSSSTNSIDSSINDTGSAILNVETDSAAAAVPPTTTIAAAAAAEESRAMAQAAAVRRFNAARARVLFRAHAKLLATPPGRRIGSFVPSFAFEEPLSFDFDSPPSSSPLCAASSSSSSSSSSFPSHANALNAKEKEATAKMVYHERDQIESEVVY